MCEVKTRPQKPPRFGQDNAIYFLTFCTFGRTKLLHLPGVPEMLIENLNFYASRIEKLVAYTIMPDHVHLIVEVGKVITLSAFLRDFKKRTSKEIKKLFDVDRSRRSATVVHASLDVATARSSTLDRATSAHFAETPIANRLLHLNRVWQPGTMDHCIRVDWTGDDFQHHIFYLFFNSKKHLDVAPKDFPFHNFIDFVQQGILDEDFCAVDEEVFKHCSRWE